MVNKALLRQDIARKEKLVCAQVQVDLLTCRALAWSLAPGPLLSSLPLQPVESTNFASSSSVIRLAGVVALWFESPTSSSTPTRDPP